MTTGNIRIWLVLAIAAMGILPGSAAAQRNPSRLAAPPKGVEREFDPDAGSEAPDDGEAAAEGQVSGVGDCETVGTFTTQFQFPARYRGNLYSITDNGVFLREIQMQLTITGSADLYVSVHRKLPNGSYVEVDINPQNTSIAYIFLDNAPALNAGPDWYKAEINNGLGVELTTGTYAIGFAWGPESIRYGRDTGVSYPKPFEVGSILASVSDELAADEPPMDAELPGLTEFSGGVYAQQLCFVPTEGACCLSDGPASRCVEVLETDCVGEGSFFHGQRTTCLDTVCEFGACCFKCDRDSGKFGAQCGDNYTEDSCDVGDGIAFWSGVSCPTDDSVLCPKQTGACCNGVNCSLRCEAECLDPSILGTYQGDDTDCDPNTHRCKGACCVTGGCLDRTRAGCAGIGGTFKLEGTRCFNQDCGGACCHGFIGYEFCEEFPLRADCVYDPENYPFIAYRGDGRDCPDTNPNTPEDCDPTPENPYVACCLPNGKCMNTFASVCTQPWIQGSPQTGFTCDQVASTVPNVCTNAVARCCFGNGGCELLTGNACTARGGTPVAGQFTCSPTACSGSGGACCGTAAGACTMRTAAQCDTAGGIYQGDDTDCSTPAATCPGYGACCRANGQCLDDQTPSDCATVGGTFRGAGTSCATLPPAQSCETRGACCAATGTCLFITAAECADIEGEFKGVGSGCGAGVCLSGACCLPTGCAKRTPLACTADQGDYMGTDVVCEVDTCVVQGGCCRSEACAVETPDACAVNSGIYLGNGTDCGVESCETGACCRISGACEEDGLQGGCRNEGEVFLAGSPCVDVECEPKGACCTDNDCSIKRSADCLGTYKGDGVACGADTCSPTGACCNGLACTIATQLACGLGGGEYEADGATCEPNPCVPPTGACCNGANCSIVTQASCAGTYQGNGSDCSPDPCQVVPTGACCDGTVCTVGTEIECSTGVYQGDGSLCGPSMCQGPPCTAILSTSPGNCSIDARRPHPQGAPVSAEGWTNIALTFNCDTGNHVLGDYDVSVFAQGAPPAEPTITGLVPSGNTITLNLSGPIPAGAWTCFTYLPANQRRCLGFLPCDADGGLGALPADIIALIDSINNLPGAALPPERCDMDRTGQCLPADIIALIDMLIGNGYAVWNGRSLPACPSAP